MKLQVVVALAALSIGGAAFAQQAPGGGAGLSPQMQAARQAMRQACATDAKTLCDGMRGREAMMCMRDHADKVSQPCKDAMAKMMAARRAPAG